MVLIQPFFTSAANRALERADDVARQTQSSVVEPIHLLWALLLEESRASEFLTGKGISGALLTPICPLPETYMPQDADRPDNRPQSEALQLVVLEARSQVALSGAQGEIGSEHLLWALAAVESSARGLLHAHGLRPEDFAGRRSAESELAAEPIAADVKLSLPGEKQTDLTDVYRILDAAANRVREGLRVLEDHVRFSLDDAHLTRLLKTWRHNFAHAFALVDERALLRSRDTPRDVGTEIHTRHEATRETLLDVVRASFKRVQEAARTLEEFGKVVSSELGVQLGRLRYELYTLEKAVLMTHASGERLAGRDLYLLVSEELCPRGSGPVIRAALAEGAAIIQIREKKMSDRNLLAHGRRVREWTKESGALLIMNDRPDLAALTDADGVHVGQDELTVREVRRIVGPGKLVGVSTHTIEQARQAVLDGADYIGVGPTFSSTTKNFRELAGLDFVRQVATEISLPAYAIGGITLDNIDQVVAAGADRVAVSSAICSAEDPAQATRDFVARMK